MGLQPLLTDTSSILVADASVVINLNASGVAAEIIAALPERMILADVVADELEEGMRKGRGNANYLQSLTAAGLLQIRPLGDKGFIHFEGLVAGPANETLDDGEAATLAYALERGATAVIDERKATRISALRFPGLQLRTTVDIFARPEIQHALGKKRLADAVFSALKEARMRVSSDQMEWVVTLIGRERVSHCVSLPSSIRDPRPPKRASSKR